MPGSQRALSPGQQRFRLDAEQRVREHLAAAGQAGTRGALEYHVREAWRALRLVRDDPSMGTVADALTALLRRGDLLPPDALAM